MFAEQSRPNHTSGVIFGPGGWGAGGERPTFPPTKSLRRSPAPGNPSPVSDRPRGAASLHPGEVGGWSLEGHPTSKALGTETGRAWLSSQWSYPPGGGGSAGFPGSNLNFRAPESPLSSPSPGTSAAITRQADLPPARLHPSPQITVKATPSLPASVPPAGPGGGGGDGGQGTGPSGNSRPRLPPSHAIPSGTPTTLVAPGREGSIVNRRNARRRRAWRGWGSAAEGPRVGRGARAGPGRGEGGREGSGQPQPRSFSAGSRHVSISMNLPPPPHDPPPSPREPRSRPRTHSQFLNQHHLPGNPPQTAAAAATTSAAAAPAAHGACAAPPTGSLSLRGPALPPGALASARETG